MRHENVAVVRERERERELFSSEIGFVNNAIKIKYIGNILKDRLLCNQVRKKLTVLRDSLSFL